MHWMGTTAEGGTAHRPPWLAFSSAAQQMAASALVYSLQQHEALQLLSLDHSGHPHSPLLGRRSSMELMPIYLLEC